MNELAKIVLQQADNNVLGALDALCDVEYLASLDVTQSEVEEAYNELLDEAFNIQ